jgi:hypothetical protein
VVAVAVEINNLLPEVQVVLVVVVVVEMVLLLHQMWLLQVLLLPVEVEVVVSRPMATLSLQQPVVLALLLFDICIHKLGLNRYAIFQIDI